MFKDRSLELEWGLWCWCCCASSVVDHKEYRVKYLWMLINFSQDCEWAFCKLSFCFAGNCFNQKQNPFSFSKVTFFPIRPGGNFKSASSFHHSGGPGWNCLPWLALIQLIFPWLENSWFSWGFLKVSYSDFSITSCDVSLLRLQVCLLQVKTFLLEWHKQQVRKTLSACLIFLSLQTHIEIGTAPSYMYMICHTYLASYALKFTSGVMSLSSLTGGICLTLFLSQ